MDTGTGVTTTAGTTTSEWGHLTRMQEGTREGPLSAQW
jgi:hypothetical protein